MFILTIQCRLDRIPVRTNKEDLTAAQGAWSGKDHVQDLSNRPEIQIPTD